MVAELKQMVVAEVVDAPVSRGGPRLGLLHARRRTTAALRRPRPEAAVSMAAVAGWALGVIVAASLVLVSLAAARPSWLAPIGQRALAPGWLAGPLGPLTGWLTLGGTGLRTAFTVLVALMYGCYVIVVLAAPSLRARWAIGVVVLVHIIFFLSPPMMLTDVFNYLNYARMTVLHGLNPYTTIPALGPSSDPTFALSNWHGLLSPYGPLFTLFTLAIVPLGLAGSFWAFKAVLMLLSLGIVWLVWRCAELLGRRPLTAALFVGLNPIVLVWGLGGEHNDYFMVFLIVLAAYLLLRAEAARVGLRSRPLEAVAGGVRPRALALAGRVFAWLDGMPRPLPRGEPGPWLEIGAGVAIAAAVAIKASAAILVPVMIFGAPRRTRFVLGGVIGALATGAATLLVFGFNLPNLVQQDGLVVQTGIPNLIGYVAGAGGETVGMHAALTYVLLLGVAVCALWSATTRRWITASGSATLLLLLTLGWLLPSYVLWLLPFAALARRRWLRVAAVAFGVYVFLFWMPYSNDLESFLHLHLSTTIRALQLSDFQHSLQY